MFSMIIPGDRILSTTAFIVFMELWLQKQSAKWLHYIKYFPNVTMLVLVAKVVSTHMKSDEYGDVPSPI